MLPVLREAGVVDAGAAGLVEIVRGIAAALAGEALPEPPALRGGGGLEAIHQELSPLPLLHRLRGRRRRISTRDELEAELELLGDSLLVVGDRTALKVHVHTDDPGAALSLGVARGTIGGHRDREHARSRRRSARSGCCRRSPSRDEPRVPRWSPSPPAPGTGSSFESFGAVVVDGGTTMNPSTADLVGAIEAPRRPRCSCCRTTGT